MNTKDYDKYFDGKHLYGDDFSLEEITQWYNSESEAYANMYGTKIDHQNPVYGSHHPVYFTC